MLPDAAEHGVFVLENLDLASAVGRSMQQGVLALGAPKSPTTRAHVNPVFIGSAKLDFALPVPTTNRTPYGPLLQLKNGA